MKPFPLNAWYAAAYDVEVKQALLARKICNQKLVMFRRKDGSVAALEDACWHRLLPLSRGRLENDEITCGYHGLVYNGDGRCTAPLAEGDTLVAGQYELVFGAGAYFAAQGVVLPDPPFLDRVVIAFGVADSSANYHVPLVLTPWSYSTYRGS